MLLQGASAAAVCSLAIAVAAEHGGPGARGGGVPCGGFQQRAVPRGNMTWNRVLGFWTAAGRSWVASVLNLSMLWFVGSNGTAVPYIRYGKVQRLLACEMWSGGVIAVV